MKHYSSYVLDLYHFTVLSSIVVVYSVLFGNFVQCHDI